MIWVKTHTGYQSEENKKFFKEHYDQKVEGLV